MKNNTAIKIIDNELYVNLNKLGIFSGLYKSIWTNKNLIDSNKIIPIHDYLYLIGSIYSLFFKNKFDCNWIMDSRYNEDSRDDSIGGFIVTEFHLHITVNNSNIVTYIDKIKVEEILYY